MSFSIEVRKKQLQSLDQYISSSKDKLQSILDCLGWSVDKLVQDCDRVTCSYNKNHVIHPSSAVEHVKKCQVKSEGYDLNEQFLSEPLNDPNKSTKIDHHQKIQILSKASYEVPNFRAAWNGKDPDPKTSDRLFSTFSSDERLALYDFCVQNTVGPPAPPELNLPNQEVTEEGKELSEGELRAIERDAKRRQVKYKSVHTNRKTYTEIMREVLEGQMTLYENYIMENNEKQTLNCDIEEQNNGVCSNKNDQPQSCEKDVDNVAINERHEVTERCSSSNSKHSNSEKYRNDKYKYDSELEGSYEKYIRHSSPGERSNASSSTSRRKQRGDRYSHHSRNSSLDSGRSSYWHEKHDSRYTNYDDRDIDHKRNKYQEHDSKYTNYDDRYIDHKRNKYQDYDKDRSDDKYRSCYDKYEKHGQRYYDQGKHERNEDYSSGKMSDHYHKSRRHERSDYYTAERKYKYRSHSSRRSRSTSREKYS